MAFQELVGITTPPSEALLVLQARLSPEEYSVFNPGSRPTSLRHRGTP